MRLFKFSVMGLICLFVVSFSPAPVPAAVEILQSNSVPSRSTLRVSSDVGSGAASTAFRLPWPCRAWSAVFVRAPSGAFDVTVQGSLDGITWYTILEKVVTDSVQGTGKVGDLPATYVRVLFTDVGSTTITVDVLGMP